MFHPHIRKSTKWKLLILLPQKRVIGRAEEISVSFAGKPLELHHLFHLKHVKWSILVMFDYVLIKETLKRKRKYPNDSTVNLFSQEIPSSYSTHIVCKWEPPHGRHPSRTWRRFFLRWDFPQHPWKNPWYMNFSLDFWTYGCKWLNGHREINMWLFVFYSIILYLWHHLMDIPQSHDVSQLAKFICHTMYGHPRRKFVFIPITGVIL